MIVAGIALLLAAAAPSPTPKPGVLEAFRLPVGRLSVSAAHVELTHRRTIEAVGGVVFHAPGIDARAERVEYDPATRALTIDGGVTLDLSLDGEHARLTASSATLDIGTNAGVLKDATVTGGGMTLKGKRIIRTPTGRYRLEDAEFTPCNCEHGRPSWEITASRISARPEGIGVMQGGVLRVKGIPVFFLPIGFAPASTERASGFLSPQFAQTGNDGVIGSLPFYLALGKLWDMTLEPGFNQERGPFAGATLRMANSRGDAEFAAMYHSDRRIQNDAVTFPGRPDLYSPDRWYTDDRLVERISSSAVGKVRVELAGDDRYGFDFGSSLMERSRPEYESNLIYEQGGGVLGLSATGNYFQDLRVVGSAGPYNSAQTVSRIGGLDLFAGGLPLIGESGLALGLGMGGRYDFFDNVGSPQQGFHKGGQLESEPRREVQHARLQPALELPVSLLDDAIRVRAFGGGLGDVSTDPLGTDSRARVSPFAGADVRAEFRRTFGEEGKTRVQHRIGPFARVTYVPGVYGQSMTSFESPGELPRQGESVDVGLTNRLLYRTKSGRAGGDPVRELLEVAVFERFVPALEGEKRESKGDSIANVDLRTGALRLDVDAVLDNTTGSMRTAGGRAATRGDAPEGLSLEYAYAPERQSHQGTSGAWLKLAELYSSDKFPGNVIKTLTVEGGLRYDVVTHSFPSVSGGLDYESPCGCWGFKAGSAKDADRPNLTWRFSIDLHPPGTVKRYTAAPGGR